MSDKLFGLYQTNIIEEHSITLSDIEKMQKDVDDLYLIYKGGIYDNDEDRHYQNALGNILYYIYCWVDFVPTDIVNEVIARIVSDPEYSDSDEEYMESYYDWLLDDITLTIKERLNISE